MNLLIVYDVPTDLKLLHAQLKLRYCLNAPYSRRLENVKNTYGSTD